MLQHHTTSTGKTAVATDLTALAFDSLTETERLMLCYLEERDLPVELCVKVRPFREIVIREA